MPRKGAEAEGRGGSGWNLDRVKELIDLLTERDVAEFEMEKDGLRIRVKRGSGTQQAEAPALTLSVPRAGALADGAAASAAPPAPASPPKEGAGSDAAGAESTDGLHIIKSPIVGTYYSSPSPTAPAFVKPGDVVHVGQVLCIIEAMKLMNEIESEADGAVARIYVENGQPVEYGQALFAIRPAHESSGGGAV